MNTIIIDNEPRLIDSKLISYFKNYKANRPKTSTEILFINIKTFIIKNYGFLLLICLLIILLYIRYIEVNRRKKYIRKLIEEKKIKKKVNFNGEIDY
jgi:hypothetical protein